MSWTNYHSHTDYCDGKGSVNDYIESAISAKFKSYGISSHNPLRNGASWGMNPEFFHNYINDIKEARLNFKNQIELSLGMEVDYFSDEDRPHHYIDQLDYWIGSIHFIDKFPNGEDWEIDGATNIFKNGLEKIFKNDIKKVISRYYELTTEMISKWQPPIIGHLDKIKIHNSKEFFFDEHEDWYLHLVNLVLEEAAKNQSIIEINTRGLYKGIVSEPYPSWHIIEMIRSKNIPIMLNSDSHHVREIQGSFEYVAERLKGLGITKLTILKNGQFREMPFDREGIIE